MRQSDTTKWQSEKCKKSSYRKVIKYKNNLYCDTIEECGEYW